MFYYFLLSPKYYELAIFLRNYWKGNGQSFSLLATTTKTCSSRLKAKVSYNCSKSAFWHRNAITNLYRLHRFHWLPLPFVSYLLFFIDSKQQQRISFPSSSSSSFHCVLIWV
jgi:hypothetical protein